MSCATLSRRRCSVKRNRAVFIDRDGTINRKAPAKDYIKSWSEFEFIPGAAEAIRLLHDRGFKAVVVTNQSQIGKGIVSQAQVDGINARMKKELAGKGAPIDGIYVCPHHPDENCPCRKPKTGLMTDAAKDLGIDILNSYVVGDSAKDILMGKNAGCAATVFVKTGEIDTGESRIEGDEVFNLKRGLRVRPDKIADDLLDAARWIVSH